MPAAAPVPIPEPPDTTRRDWTIEEVRALVAANPLLTPRYELVDGELLVTPSPSNAHQLCVSSLMAVLIPYVATHRLGRVLTSPSDIEIVPGRMVQPDVFVVPVAEMERTREFPYRTLLLAVEVLSPSSARYDRLVKRRLYQRAGVPEYWVFDLEARLVERWRPGDERPEVTDATLSWQPAGATEPLAIELPPLFADAWGEGEP